METRPLFLFFLFLTLGILIYFEWIRLSKRNRIGRLISVLVLVLSIIGILFPIPWPFSRQDPGNRTKNSAWILTEGFRKEELSPGPGQKILTTDLKIKSKIPYSSLIPNFKVLKSWFPEIQKVIVLGYGLDQEQIDQIRDIPISFHPEPIPQGILRVHWTPSIKRGESFRVQGQIHGSIKNSLRLVLKGEGLAQDSVQIMNSGFTDFSLQTIPKGIHKMVYTLLLLKGRDTLEKEPIPFTVLENKGLKFGLLSSSPNYENHFLENWLRKRDISIWSRTQVSKNRESLLSVERNKKTFITESNLNPLDLLIMDQKSLEELSPSEFQILRNAIVKKGMGLILQADSPDHKKNRFNPGFSLERRMDSSLSSRLYSHLQPPLKSPISLGPFFIKNESGIQNLVDDGKNHSEISLMLQGEGKILISLLSTSYTWSLQGDTGNYSRLWSYLISKTAQKKLDSALIWSEETFPRTQKEIILHIMDSKRPTISSPFWHSWFIQDQNLPFYWTVSLWPQDSGWLEDSNRPSVFMPIYIFKEGDWKNQEYLKKTEQTLLASKNFSLVSSNSSINSYKYPENIPKLFFFLVFLGAISYLWVERKFWSE